MRYAKWKFLEHNVWDGFFTFIFIYLCAETQKSPTSLFANPRWFHSIARNLSISSIYWGTLPTSQVASISALSQGFLQITRVTPHFFLRWTFAVSWINLANSRFLPHLNMFIAISNWNGIEIQYVLLLLWLKIFFFCIFFFYL